MILDERALRRELGGLVTTPQAFPPVTLVDANAMAQLTTGLYEVGKDGETLEYDQPWCVIDEGIWTDHMGP